MYFGSLQLNRISFCLIIGVWILACDTDAERSSNDRSIIETSREKNSSGLAAEGASSAETKPLGTEPEALDAEEERMVSADANPAAGGVDPTDNSDNPDNSNDPEASGGTEGMNDDEPQGLEALSDEFDDSASLADWSRIWEEESWPYDQLETYDIGTTRSGALTMEPYTSSWYENYRGVLAFKEVSGDFIATTRVLVTNRDGDGPPANNYSLAGMMIRGPRAITAATWESGGENYIFLSLGRGDNGSNPGGYETEVKTTVDSDSTLQIGEAPSNDLILRGARIGQYFFLLLREPDSSWQVHRRYQRSDLPLTLQVGMVSYTDWDRVSMANPMTYNNWSAPPASGANPDVLAHFDYFRFSDVAPPATWDGLDLSDSAVVSDAALLAVLAAD